MASKPKSGRSADALLEYSRQHAKRPGPQCLTCRKVPRDLRVVVREAVDNGVSVHIAAAWLRSTHGIDLSRSALREHLLRPNCITADNSPEVGTAA